MHPGCILYFQWVFSMHGRPMIVVARSEYTPPPPRPTRNMYCFIAFCVFMSVLWMCKKRKDELHVYSKLLCGDPCISIADHFLRPCPSHWIDWSHLLFSTLAILVHFHKDVDRHLWSVPLACVHAMKSPSLSHTENLSSFSSRLQVRFLCFCHTMGRCSTWK